MLFKVFKVINPWTRKEEDTGEVVSVNPVDTAELDRLARKYDTMYIAAHGDEESPDYLWGFKVFWDDEGFEQYQTDYIFRPVNEQEVR